MKLFELLEKAEKLNDERARLLLQLETLKEKEAKILAVAEFTGEKPKMEAEINDVEFRLSEIKKLFPALEKMIGQAREKEKFENEKKVTEEMKKLQNEAEKLQQEWNSKVTELQAVFEKMKAANYRAISLTGNKRSTLFGRAFQRMCDRAVVFTEKLERGDFTGGFILKNRED